MLKQRRAAADDIRSKFLAAEVAVDEAAIRTAESLHAALAGRAAANVPLSTGLDAIEMLTRGCIQAVEARRTLIEAHRIMAPIPAEIGLGVVGYGQTSDCPPIDKPSALGGRHLQAVA